MATTLTSTRMTLLDLANRQSNGNIQKVAEVLTETNEILIDAVFMEANGTTGHKGTVRTSLPSGSWRKINDGVAKEKSTTRQIIESFGLLESNSEVDRQILQYSKNPAATRQSEDVAFLEGFSQTLADTFIYGDTDTYPERFKGLAYRITSSSASNAIDAGGSGSDTTSVFIVQWGEERCSFIYPQGSPNVGIEVTDMGLQYVDGETSDTKFWAYVTNFKMHAGLYIPDTRCIQRICNIESSGSSNILDPEDLVTALNRMPNRGRGAVIYANETTMTQLDKLAMQKSNVYYTGEDAFGNQTVFFRGHPIRKVEAILDTETAI